MEIKLRPFVVPLCAVSAVEPKRREDGWWPAPTIPLGNIPAPELAALCDQFRRDVFKAAGKEDPAEVKPCATCHGIGTYVDDGKTWGCDDCDCTGRVK